MNVNNNHDNAQLCCYATTEQLKTLSESEGLMKWDFS